MIDLLVWLLTVVLVIAAVSGITWIVYSIVTWLRQPGNARGCGLLILGALFFVAWATFLDIAFGLDNLRRLLGWTLY
jgi:hypothetical protein